MSDNFLLSVNDSIFSNPNKTLNNNNNNNNNKNDGDHLLLKPTSLSPPTIDTKKNSPLHPFNLLDSPKDIDLHRRSPCVLDIPRPTNDLQASTGLDLSKFKPDSRILNEKISPTSKSHPPSINPYVNPLGPYPFPCNSPAGLNGLSLNKSPSLTFPSLPTSSPVSLSVNNNHSSGLSLAPISRSNSVPGDTPLSTVFKMESITNGYNSRNRSPDDTSDSSTITNGDFIHQNFNHDTKPPEMMNNNKNNNSSSNTKSPSSPLSSSNATVTTTTSSSSSSAAASSAPSSTNSAPAIITSSNPTGRSSSSENHTGGDSVIKSSSNSSSSSSPTYTSQIAADSHIAAKLMENNYPKMPDAYCKILEEYGKGSKFNDDMKLGDSFYDKFPDSYSKQIEALANGYRSNLSPSSALSKNGDATLSPGGFPKSDSNGIFPKPDPSLSNGILGKMEPIPISSSPPQVLPSILNFSTNHLRGLASAESGLANYLTSFGMGGGNPPSSVGDSNRNSNSGGGISSGGGSNEGIARASPNNKLACRFCGKTFSQAGYIKAHERLHTGEKPFACSVCGKRFSDPSNWKKHERVHANTKKGDMVSRDSKVKNIFIKSMSSLVTSSLQQRLAFRPDVTGPVMCKLCGKLFSSQSSLSTHKRIHTGERPYRCSSCGKSFTQIGTLRTHERIHTGEKPYICKVCGRTFAQSGSYRMHERRHMTDSIQRCHVCYATFSTWQELQRHMASHPQVTQAILEFEEGNEGLVSKLDSGQLGDDSMGQSGHGQDGDCGTPGRDLVVHNPPGHPPPLIPESLLLDSDVSFHAQAQGLYPSPGQLPPFSSILPFRPHPGVPPAFPPTFPSGLGLLGNQGMPVTSHAELMSKHSFFGALNMALGHQPPHLHLQDHHHHHQQQLHHPPRLSSQQQHQHQHQQQQQQHQQQQKSHHSQQQLESPYSDGGAEVVSTTSSRKNEPDFLSPVGRQYSPEFDKMSEGGKEGGMREGGVVFPRRYSHPEVRMSSDDVTNPRHDVMGREEDIAEDEERERERGDSYGRRYGGSREEEGDFKRRKSMEEDYSEKRNGESEVKRRRVMSDDDHIIQRMDYSDSYGLGSKRESGEDLRSNSNNNNNNGSSGGRNNSNNSNSTKNISRSSIFNKLKNREDYDDSDSFFNAINSNNNNNSSSSNSNNEDDEDNDDGDLLPPPPRRHIEKQNLNTRMLSSSSSSSGRKQKHPMRRFSSAGSELESPQSTCLPVSSITSTTDVMDRGEERGRQSDGGEGVEADDRQMLDFLLKQGRVHKCQHCRIIFEDASLFLLHNGFHANQDPFECVVCRQVCKDRIEFNCHLTTHIK